MKDKNCNHVFECFRSRYKDGSVHVIVRCKNCGLRNYVSQRNVDQHIVRKIPLKLTESQKQGVLFE